MYAKAIIHGKNRVCDVGSCVHTIEEHTGGQSCTQCNCKQLHLRRDRICMRGQKGMNAGVLICFGNCLERNCPSCSQETTIDGYKEEKRIPKSHFPDKFAIHRCRNCSFVSYYQIEMQFERYLHDQLNVRFEDVFGTF